MKFLKLGFLIGLAMLAVSLILMPVWNIFFPNVQQEYVNSALFRPWSDPLMSLVFINPFIVGVILSWIWQKTKTLFKERIWWKKGKQFGLVYWFVTLPGMVMSISTFPISFTMVLTWTFTGLFQALAAGLMLAKLEK